jgi:predicted RNase H-like HicB family nuclease
MPMRFQVMLKKTDEGYAVWCPTLPGCWSQGETEAEALQNIRDAIREYLEAVQQLTTEGDEVREVEVSLSYV